MKHPISIAALLLALLFTAFNVRAGASFAGSTSQPDIRLQAWMVLSSAERGTVQERLQPLQPQIRPGDVIEYEALYINGTAKAAQNVQLTLPVPSGGIQYLPVASSATPVHSASLDGRHFEPVPLRREVRLPDGSKAMQEVPVSEYRFLRWNLGNLPAGAQRTVRARMQLPALAVASRS